MSVDAPTAHHWPVFGHDWAVEYLQKGILNRRVRHAYLITGTSSLGKRRLADSFAMALNCLHEDIESRPCLTCRSCKKIISGNHTDLLLSETDANSGRLRIDAIRAVTNLIAMKPYEGRYRVAIFENFDKAEPRAQDALLKTLEEPPPHAILILIASSLEPILSTITSRSQIITLRPVPSEKIAAVLIDRYNMLEEEALLLGRFSGGRIGWAIQAAEDESIIEQRTTALDILEDVLRKNRAGRFTVADQLSRDKLALYPLLELWQTYWRDVLLFAENSPVKICNTDRQRTIEEFALDMTPEEAFQSLKATSDLLDKLSYNINLRLALEVMFLDYPLP